MALPAYQNPLVVQTKKPTKLYYIFVILLTFILSPFLILIRLITIPIVMMLYMLTMWILNLNTHYPKPLSPVRALLTRFFIRLYSILILLGQGIIIIPLNRQKQKSRLYIFNHTNMYDALAATAVTPYSSIMKDSLIQNSFCRSIYKTTRSYIAERPCPKGKYVKKYLEIQQSNGSISHQIENRLKTDPYFKLSMSPEGTILAQGFTARYHTSIFRYNQPIQPFILKYYTLLPTHWTTNNSFFVILSYVFNPCGFITVKFLPQQQQKDGETVEEYADRVGRYMAEQTKCKYVKYKNSDMYYASCGKVDKCSEEWQKDFGWMGQDLNQFYRKHGLNPNFVVYKEDLLNIKIEQQ